MNKDKGKTVEIPNRNFLRGEETPNQVDLIFKLLQSLPPEAKEKTLAELNKRLLQDKNATKQDTSTPARDIPNENEECSMPFESLPQQTSPQIPKQASPLTSQQSSLHTPKETDTLTPKETFPPLPQQSPPSAFQHTAPLQTPLETLEKTPMRPTRMSARKAKKIDEVAEKINMINVSTTVVNNAPIKDKEASISNHVPIPKSPLNLQTSLPTMLLPRRTSARKAKKIDSEKLNNTNVDSEKRISKEATIPLASDVPNVDILNATLLQTSASTPLLPKRTNFRKAKQTPNNNTPNSSKVDCENENAKETPIITSTVNLETSSPALVISSEPTMTSLEPLNDINSTNSVPTPREIPQNSVVRKSMRPRKRKIFFEPSEKNPQRTPKEKKIDPSLDPKISLGCVVKLERLDELESQSLLLSEKPNAKSGKKRGRKRKSKIRNETILPSILNNPVVIKVEAISDSEEGPLDNAIQGEVCPTPDIVDVTPKEERRKKGRPPKYPGRKNYCHECDKQYLSRNGYLNHFYQHTGEAPHPCTYCHKRFTLKSALDLHIRRHENNKPFVCSMCDYKSVSKIDVLKHMAGKHSMCKDYMCEFCGRGFAAKSRLNTHLKFVHNYGVKPENCHICSRIFKSKFFLKRHIITAHTKEEQYECPVCNKIIISKHNLKQHMHKHDEERGCVCPMCDKTFPTKPRLELHMLSHQEPSMECEVCHRKFKSAFHLKRHAIIHSADKPYACHLCEYKCNVSGNLTKHVRLVHQIIDFKIREYKKNLSSIFPNPIDENINILEQSPEEIDDVLRKTSETLGREYTFDELEEAEKERLERKRLLVEQKEILANQTKRRRGRPPKIKVSNVANGPFTVTLKKDTDIVVVPKTAPSRPSKEACKKISELIKTVDLGQYIFEMEDEMVDVNIESDEEGKKIKMYIIEVLSEDENDDDEEPEAVTEELEPADEPQEKPNCEENGDMSLAIEDLEDNLIYSIEDPENLSEQLKAVNNLPLPNDSNSIITNGISPNENAQ